MILDKIQGFHNSYSDFENLTKIFESADESVTNRSGVKFYTDILIWGIFWVFPKKLPETISFCKICCVDGKKQLDFEIRSKFRWHQSILDKKYLRPVFYRIFYSRIMEFEQIYNSFFFTKKKMNLNGD